MQLSPSAHVDTFCRDNLPPVDQWPQLSFGLPELTYPERLNCADALLEGASPDRPCLRTTTDRWTYGQLRHKANQVAQVLTEDHGLVPGNRVLLRGPNNPWLVACWFGVLQAGGVVVTTMPLLRTSELRALADLTSPTLAISDHRFVADLRAVSRPGMTVLSYGAGGFEADCATKSGTFSGVPTAADDVAMLAATSGTTGKPKITMHFHRDVLAIADTFSKHVLQPNAEDLFTGTPPLGFTFGLGGLLVFPLRCGASTLLLEKVTPKELAEVIAAHGVTVLFTAPTAYKAMLTTGNSASLTGLRRCVSAGEHLPESVWRSFFQRTGVRIIDGIGATEMLHIFIGSADDAVRPGSTGRVVPGYEACVLDDRGVPVPDGTAGRLAVRGPTGCRYLADQRQETYARDGWNITGDTYVRDPDGYFWFRARSDDMIVSAGYNIAGPEVEQVLAGHPDVVESAVVGVPDDARGSIVKAFVVLAEGATADASKVEQLQEFVKQTISPYKYPREIEFVAELPRTSSGKIMRYVLRGGAAKLPD